MGFFRIIEISRLQLDWLLITALIERCFTACYQRLYRSAVPGDVAVLSGFQPADDAALSGASRLQLMPVRLHLEAMHADITDDTPDLHTNRYTRLLMLLMFGGVLFPNTSGNLVSLRFLHHPERLDDLLGYSWGEAVLDYLYMQMCRVSMGTHRDVAGLLPLLQVKT
ncbi:protein MAIN-LIKE 2-like [Nicotiana sylvestris]|uniref:protein MAIN-LIKE 2-like n=1 Tax=Nicotiana sylvestris TaxID=4096 RepID=UPI00388CD7C2